MRLRAPVCLAMLTAGGFLAFGETRVAAQSHLITADDTLGAEGSTVTRVAPQVDLIEGGALRDEHLFHSFEEFNIGEGWTANFANPDGVFSILSRVTGENPSNLFGTLGVLGDADLFFINPNGVLFGPDASLDIPGSLMVSTADGLVLPDGSVYSATNPGVPQLLEIDVDVPIGVLFDSDLAAALGNEALLEVGENLTLSAGDVDSGGVLFAPNGDVLVEGTGDVRVQDMAAQSAVLSAGENLVLEESRLQTAGDLSLLAGDTVRVRDSEENPFWAVAGGDLLVRGDELVDILALNHLDITSFQSEGDLTLISGGNISGDAHFYSNGNFSILDLLAEPNTFVSLYDPVVFADGDVEFGDYTGAALLVRATGSILGGNISIDRPDPLLRTACNLSPICSGSVRSDIEILSDEPGVILRAGLDPGNLGRFTVSPIFDIFFPGVSERTLLVPTAIVGGTDFRSPDTPINPRGSIQVSSINAEQGGSVILESQSPAGNIIVTDDIPIASLAGVNVRGGSIAIDANGSVAAEKGVLTVRQNNPEPAGDIVIGGIRRPNNVTVGALSSRNGNDDVPANSNSNNITNNGGNIEVFVNGTLSVTGAFNTNPDREFQGLVIPNPNQSLEDLVIQENQRNSENASVDDYVSIASQANGNGGNIKVEARDGIKTFGNIISASSPVGRDPDTEQLDEAIGRGGLVDLMAPGGFIEVVDIRSFGPIGGGNICLTAGISTNGDGCAPEGGFLSSDLIPSAIPNVDMFILVNDIESRVTQANTGKAGQVTIAGRNQITTRNITTTSIDGSGADTSGDIDLVSIEGGIDTSQGTLNASTSDGDAGDIRLNSFERIKVGDISSTSNSGNSDEIILISQGDIIIDDSDISSASGAEGISGDVTINSLSTVSLKNSDITVTTRGDDSAGDIQLVGEDVLIENSNIDARSLEGEGQVGELSITATEGDIRLINSVIRVFSDEDSSGSGNIAKLSANSVFLQDGSRIVSATFGTGDAGSIEIEFSEDFRIFGTRLGAASGLFTSSESLESGRGGDITVNANQTRGRMYVADGGFLNTRTLSERDGSDSGDIIVNVNELQLRNGGQLFTSAQKIGRSNNTADAGDIVVNASDRVIISGNSDLISSPQVELNISGTIAEDESDENDDLLEDLIKSPQRIFRDQFAVDSDSNVYNSERNPHISIESSSEDNNGTLDFYSINFPNANELVIFDVDNADDFDAKLFLFLPDESGKVDIDESTVIANSGFIGGGPFAPFPTQEGDSPNSLILPQSASQLDGAGSLRNAEAISVVGQVLPDPIIATIIPQAGEYIIAIGQQNTEIDLSAPNTNPLENKGPKNDNYTLNISTTDLSLDSIRIFNPAQRQNSGLFAESEGNNNSGAVRINTANLSVRDGGRIETSTQGGIANNVSINQNSSSANRVEISGQDSGLFAQASSFNLEQDGVVITYSGIAGNIAVNAENLQLENGAEISATNVASDILPNNQNEFGNIFLQNLDTLTVNDSQISTSTGVGTAGSISINSESGTLPASSVSLNNGGKITAQANRSISEENGLILPDETTEDSRAGNITVNALEVELIDDSQISASNEGSMISTSEEQKLFGNILLQNLDTLKIDSSLISTSTQTGAAGSVSVNVSESITLSGNISSRNGLNDDSKRTNSGGIFAIAESGGTAGSVLINSDPNHTINSDSLVLDVANQAVIAVSSPSGEAGNIGIEANEINLTRGASIRSVTGDDGSNPDSGDIDITLRGPESIFWLRYGERNFREINASGRGNATGGTITIGTNDDDGFIIAIPSEDSDISTEAFDGDGGRVLFGESDKVNFTGRTFVLGLRERPNDTFLSDVLVASNQGSSGLVGFSDPINEGFFELEEELLLPSSPNLDEGCQIGTRERQAEFFDYGLGGAPPGPDELMGGGNILTDWIPLDLADPNHRPIDLGTFVTAPTISNTANIGHSMNLLSLCTADEDE